MRSLLLLVSGNRAVGLIEHEDVKDEEGRRGKTKGNWWVWACAHFIGLLATNEGGTIIRGVKGTTERDGKLGSGRIPKPSMEEGVWRAGTPGCPAQWA